MSSLKRLRDKGGDGEPSEETPSKRSKDEESLSGAVSVSEVDKKAKSRSSPGHSPRFEDPFAKATKEAMEMDLKKAETTKEVKLAKLSFERERLRLEEQRIERDRQERQQEREEARRRDEARYRKEIEERE